MTYERPVLSLDARHSGLPISSFSPYPRPLFMLLHLLACPQSTFQSCHCSPHSTSKSGAWVVEQPSFGMHGGLAFHERSPLSRKRSRQRAGASPFAQVEAHAGHALDQVTAALGTVVACSAFAASPG